MALDLRGRNNREFPRRGDLCVLETSRPPSCRRRQTGPGRLPPRWSCGSPRGYPQSSRPPSRGGSLAGALSGRPEGCVPPGSGARGAVRATCVAPESAAADAVLAAWGTALCVAVRSDAEPSSAAAHLGPLTALRNVDRSPLPLDLTDAARLRAFLPTLDEPQACALFGASAGSDPVIAAFVFADEKGSSLTQAPAGISAPARKGLPGVQVRGDQLQALGAVSPALPPRVPIPAQPLVDPTRLVVALSDAARRGRHARVGPRRPRRREAAAPRATDPRASRQRAVSACVSGRCAGGRRGGREQIGSGLRRLRARAAIRDGDVI